MEAIELGIFCKLRDVHGGKNAAKMFLLREDSKSTFSSCDFVRRKMQKNEKVNMTKRSIEILYIFYMSSYGTFQQ